jgi:hypothetical protein
MFFLNLDVKFYLFIIRILKDNESIDILKFEEDSSNKSVNNLNIKNVSEKNANLACYCALNHMI